MNKTLLKLNLFFAILVLPFALTAQQTDIKADVQKAMASPIRDDADRHADTYRKPDVALSFFGLKNDMRVIELIPAGGYYTKILGQVLNDKGQLYVGADGEAVAEKLAGWGLSKVQVLDDKFEMTRTDKRGHNSVAPFEFPVKDVDMVLTFRNMHNIAPDSRKLMNTAVFNALKSGGIYGVVDHTRRHMEPWDEARWRRVDPVTMIKELQDIGFVFVDYSDLAFTANDNLTLDSTHESLKRNSDNFTLKFRKP
jgi:predicted methyltransferase